MPKVLEKNVTDSSPENGEMTDVFSEIGLDEENSPAHLKELRKIIVQPDEVGDVLPDAIKNRFAEDELLAEATLPLTETNIRESVERDPQVLATSLAPIIGPAIGKAIAIALEKSSQSLNQTLEQSLSPKGIGWRIEAMRTGKPFAEIVMLRTLLYRVEQVFLIHKKTGLLLQHVAAETAETQDGEMVSAMLTAIQDFVQDSFQVSENATLDALKINELSVWIESRRDAVLAAVIRGNAPLNLRETLAETIEKIQFDRERELEKFDGDADKFESSRPLLEECLQQQKSESEQGEKDGIFTPLNVLAGIFGILILTLVFFQARDYWRWSSYVERLKTENGIVVTEENRGWFTHEIEGLRDELAIDPNAILGDYGFEKDDVKSIWKNYSDLSEPIVLERAKRILKPPPNVELKLENGVLTVHGNPPNEWLSRARQTSAGIAGVKDFQVLSK